MPAQVFHAGDERSWTVDVCNLSDQPLDGYPLFVILDILGAMVFAPSFIDFDHCLLLNPSFPIGLTTVIVNPAFEWPSGIDPLDGLIWYAGWTDPAMTHLVGKYDFWSFGCE